MNDSHLVTIENSSLTVTPITEETSIPTKAEKLASRGAEHPEVARAARDLTELLIRMALGQANYFAEDAAKAFPNLTQAEASRLGDFFSHVSTWFYRFSPSNPHPEIKHDNPIRSWESNRPYFYDVMRILSVLACQEPLCPHNNCWETRRADCTEESARIAAEYKKRANLK
jgi:hypothetical protein